MTTDQMMYSIMENVQITLSKMYDLQMGLMAVDGIRGVLVAILIALCVLIVLLGAHFFRKGYR